MSDKHNATLAALPEGGISQEELDRLFDAMPAAERTGTLPNEEAFIGLDHRTCDCPLTYVHRKRHAALGTGVQIRLCCLARFVEERFGLPPGTFFLALDFEPTWVWDCDHVSTVQRRTPDGATESVGVRLGPPPRWLLERMRAKGVAVRNLPDDLKE